MYLTAQRVVAPGVRGVNVYEYLQGPVTWNHPLPRNFRPEENPGELRRRWEDVPTVGGNAVISYLDIVVPDSVPSATVAHWVGMIKYVVNANGLFPREQIAGPLWIRFGMSRIGIPPQTELAALAAHILLRVFRAE
jgi:hypothetical protein